MPMKLNQPYMTLPYTGTTDLLQFRRVKITGGEPAYAGASDQDIGELDRRVIGTPSSGPIPLGAGAGAMVVMREADGVHWMVASGAITQYAAVYAAASGKVSATVSLYYIGYAETAATADGDFIGVVRRSLPTIGPVENVVTDIDGATYTAADSGTITSTAGAVGTATFVLPVATIGLCFTFHVGAAQECRIDPNGSETIGLPSSGVQGAAGKYLTANAVGEWVKLLCVIAGTWTPQGYAGTWTAEA